VQGLSGEICRLCRDLEASLRAYVYVCIPSLVEVYDVLGDIGSMNEKWSRIVGLVVVVGVG
jgi:hypothetical protein